MVIIPLPTPETQLWQFISQADEDTLNHLVWNFCSKHHQTVSHAQMRAAVASLIERGKIVMVGERCIVLGN